jgi:hypothetical protein
MTQVPISRRRFCEGVMAGTGLLSTAHAHARVARELQAPVASTGSHLGNLYPFVQGQANRSQLELRYTVMTACTCGGRKRLSRTNTSIHI